MACVVDNELQRRTLRPHLTLEEAFPLPWKFRLILLDLNGGHGGTELRVNDLIPFVIPFLGF